MNHKVEAKTNFNEMIRDKDEFTFYGYRVVFAMSCQFYTNNKAQDLRTEITALKRELREANNEPDILLRNLKIRWANFKLEEAIAKLRRMI